VIGKTGSGKSNFVLNYLERSAGEFTKFYIFTGSTLDEPLYNAIKDNPKVIMFNDIDEMPRINKTLENKFIKISNASYLPCLKYNIYIYMQYKNSHMLCY